MRVLFFILQKFFGTALWKELFSSRRNFWHQAGQNTKSPQTPTAYLSSCPLPIRKAFLSSICTKTMQTFVLVINVKKYHAFILHNTPPHLGPHSPSPTTSIPLTSPPPSLGSSAAVRTFFLSGSPLAPGIFHP